MRNAALGRERSRWRITPWLSVAAVVVASLVPETRGFVLVALVAALLFASFGPGPEIPVVLRSSAAAIPVAVYLAWGAIPVPTTPGFEWCGDLLASPVVRTVAGACATIASVFVVNLRLRGSIAALGFVRPSPKTVAASLATGLAVAIGSLVLGTVLAGPFFGTVELKLDNPGAVVPALIYAFASGSMQEVAYRGAMLGWLTPDLGPRWALIAQALAFGAGHGGADFVASPLPVMAAVAFGGAVAGLIVQRYRSLTFVVIVHAAFDIPLYYVAACRLV